jgi:hypothetical protein
MKRNYFKNHFFVKRSGCGFVVCNDIGSCIPWCRQVKECIGEEMYIKTDGTKNSPLNQKGNTGS